MKSAMLEVCWKNTTITGSIASKYSQIRRSPSARLRALSGFGLCGGSVRSDQPRKTAASHVVTASTEKTQ